jgi:spoIIIJ-associated protein
MDEHTERGKEWLEEFLKLAGLPCRVSTELHTVAGEDSQWLVIDHTTLTSEKIELLIGSGGSVLDSVQYLANTILNLGQDKEVQGAFTIELDGYRVRRQAELKALAEQAAEQVRETGQEYELKSLSSAERRQIHTFLKECTDLETYSRGQEPDRRLVVRLLQS